MPSTGSINDKGLVWGQNNKWNYVPGISDSKTYKKQPQPQPQPQPQQRAQAQPQSKAKAVIAQATPTFDKTAATAQAEIDAAEKIRIAKEKADADAKIEQERYEGVSKKEGEKRRKEFEERSKYEAGKITGGQAFIRSIEQGKTPTPTQGTILGLPKDTNSFTKFGESINRAANLTFSSPQTKFGGM